MKIVPDDIIDSNLQNNNAKRESNALESQKFDSDINNQNYESKKFSQ